MSKLYVFSKTYCRLTIWGDVFSVCKLYFVSQCNTNIKFWSEYKYKYIQNIDFDRIQIPNLFVPMKWNIHIRILNIRCIIFKYIPNICRIWAKSIPNMHRIYIYEIWMTEYEYRIYSFRRNLIFIFDLLNIRVMIFEYSNIFVLHCFRLSLNFFSIY